MPVRNCFIFIICCVTLQSSNICTALVLSDLALPIDVEVKAEVENYGIYKLIDRTDTTFVAEATAGYSSVVSSALVTQTDKVPLVRNILFGFNYTIEDSEVDAQWVPVEIQIEHPATVNYLGYQSTGFKKKGAAKLKSDGRFHNGAFYLFSEDYEMVSGPWSISIVYRGERVLSMQFFVGDGQY